MLQPEVPAVDTPQPPTGAGSSARADVAVVGGGASGTLTAIHLMASRSHDLSVTVHDASGELGKGLAYGTTDRRHLLNVRSRHMSAFPEIPSDLVEWARRTGRQPDAQAFLPRRDYAVYLGRDPRPAARRPVVVPRRAGARRRAGGRRVRAARQRRAGHPARVRWCWPTATSGRPRSPSTACRSRTRTGTCPTRGTSDRLSALAADAVVVLVGSGLTAIDTAITLLDDAPERRVVMVSRHGLLPAAHVEQSSTAWLSPIPTGPVTADQLAELLRRQVAAAQRQGVDWRPVVDGLRTPTQGLWMRLDLDERRRFLSTYARAWEVRRHRMAPEVAARLDRYRDEGRLEVLDGGLAGLTDHVLRCEVELPALPDTLFADAVVNCTGPMTDISRSTDPLLRALVRRGLVTPDPLRLGVSCTPQGEVLDVSGQLVPGLYVVGPPRKGTLWETTAVPEIRGPGRGRSRRACPSGCGGSRRPDRTRRSQAAGRYTRKVLPRPSSESTSIRPACRVTIRSTMVRPRPVPPCALTSAESERKNSRNS